MTTKPRRIISHLDKTNFWIERDSDLLKYFEDFGIVLPSSVVLNRENLTYKLYISLLEIFQHLYEDQNFRKPDIINFFQDFVSLPDDEKESYITSLRQIVNESDYESFRLESSLNQIRTDQIVDDILSKVPVELRLRILYEMITGEELTAEMQAEFESDLASSNKLIEELNIEEVKYLVDTASERYVGREGLRLDKDQPEDTIPNTRPGNNIITQMTPKMVSPERLREIIAGNKSRQQLQPASEITPTQVPLEAPVQLPQIRQQPPAQNPKNQIPTQPRARVSQTPPAFPVRNSAAYRNLPGVVRPGSK